MPFTNAKVVATSPDPKFWPAQDLPEFLMTGKSNVGKSSLINAMCGMKKLAYVGKTPGKTRMLNFFEVKEGLRLVDAPGYGFQKTDPRRNIDFEKLMNTYFQTREVCKGILILMDARRDVSEEDLLMKQLAEAYGIPVLVVITKMDKMNQSEKTKRPRYVSEAMGIDSSRIILTSSEKKSGVDGLVQRILAMK